MSHMRSIVLGEASESDNDDEIFSYEKGRLEYSELSIVSGEAPESDDDQAPTVFQIPPSGDKIVKNLDENEKRYNTLLHKKLCESNQKLRKSIADVYTSTTSKAIKQLSTADRNLLQSQIILQSASGYLHSVEENLRHLHTRLHDVLDCNFIPDIHIPKE
ncbi:uncharacterized protein LOC113386858 [Ctenocephalides felis]|uniref:uncharacterized protein LOC113386858 n=1 Tax=Ctenocephalides felis TaxID=7515 RepID=UPI000E6E1C0B|nr:uncharacterized protein LOC113386858 [Ctenocephalides felis]